LDLLASINSRAVSLLDHGKLLRQLIALERRTARSGKDSIDHMPGSHDDVANAVAGRKEGAKRSMNGNNRLARCRSMK
jgi:hypothetical protein